jgi:hypothetical protein
MELYSTEKEILDELRKINKYIVLHIFNQNTK